MTRAAIILFVCIFAGCAGSVATLDDGTAAKILANQDRSYRLQADIFRAVSELDGKSDALIKLKRDEIEALKAVRESFDRTQQMLERLFTLQRDNGGAQRR